MSSREVSAWRAYEAIEPFGERRADYRAASVCLTIALANGAKNVELKDFLLSTNDAKPEPDVLSMAFALGAKVVPREPE
jgi:hypothetical protein